LLLLLSSFLNYLSLPRKDKE